MSFFYWKVRSFRIKYVIEAVGCLSHLISEKELGGATLRVRIDDRTRRSFLRRVRSYDRLQVMQVFPTPPLLLTMAIILPFRCFTPRSETIFPPLVLKRLHPPRVKVGSIIEGKPLRCQPKFLPFPSDLDCG